MLSNLLPPRDPRTLNWYCAGNWTLFLYVIGAYVGLVKIVLPQYMANRKPMKIIGFIRAYNLLLVVFNVYFFYNFITRTYLGGGYSWFCQGVRNTNSSQEDLNLLNLSFYYFLVRISEFLDTIFFVLRKKFNQASVLNISHHCISIFLPWFGFTYGFDGQGLLMVQINMAVHVIMYSYYFLASFPEAQPYLGWKRYLTMIQIAQFFVSLTHISIPIVYDCGYPPIHSILSISALIYFVFMFTAFYGSAYQKAKSTSKRLDTLTDSGVLRTDRSSLKMA